MDRSPPPKAATSDVDPEERLNIRQQQHTGNHDKPAGEDSDTHAGTRHGAKNVEKLGKGTSP